jgi:hypothetical protein
MTLGVCMCSKSNGNENLRYTFHAMNVTIQAELSLPLSFSADEAGPLIVRPNLPSMHQQLYIESTSPKSYVESDSSSLNAPPRNDCVSTPPVDVTPKAANEPFREIVTWTRALETAPANEGVRAVDANVRLQPHVVTCRNVGPPLRGGSRECRCWIFAYDVCVWRQELHNRSTVTCCQHPTRTSASRSSKEVPFYHVSVITRGEVPRVPDIKASAVYHGS